MPSDHLNLLFIRHAESAWNLLGRWQGQANPPLSPRARDQIGTLCRYVESLQIEFALVLSSDLRRARDTARPLAQHLGVPLEVTPALRERNLGKWTGGTALEIERGWPLLAEAFSTGHTTLRPPGGESRRELIGRVGAELDAVHDRVEGRTIAVVSHLGVLRAFFPGTHLSNTAAVWLTFKLPAVRGACLMQGGWLRQGPKICAVLAKNWG